MSKRTKVTFSLILVICLLLSGLPNAFPVAATEADKPLTSPITESTVTEPQAVTEQSTAVTEEIPVLQLDADCQILNHVDPEVFAAGNHIARLPEQETLSSYVFLNADGSQTVYYMDQPVRFEKADGTVVEKNLTLTAATEGYTTTQNDIQLTIPTNPTNGIRLIYDSHQITLIPQGGTLANAVQATDSSVTYLDYYGEGMSLRYTPTLSGVKEDILLDAYSGVNSFTFRLNTGGLNLYQANGRYYLAESKAATDRIELGEVVTYDAKSKFSIGTMTAQTIMPGQAYMLTLTADEAFLANENTTYPVTIDPTLTISYGNNGDNYIIDAPIFEGYPNNNYGAFQYNRVGYVDSSYQSGRTVVKLPVLTSSSIYTSLTAANITSVKFHVKEATGSSGISVSLYPLTSNSTWTETNVTWNNVGSRASTATDTKTLTDSAWSAFDITALVKQWKNGTQNANRGFIMIGANENSLDKSFCSSEHEKASYRPYVVMTYNSGVSLNHGAVNIDEGNSFTITATTSPAGQAVTWTSSDESVATVNGSGVVTALKAGQTYIRATKTDGTFASCTVYVTVADGVYRIKSSCGLYLGTYGSIAENTAVRLLAYSEDDPMEVRQLWKVKYISSGYYSIRPMHNLKMGLHATSNSVDITTTAGTSDTLSSVLSNNRWGICVSSGGTSYNINNLNTSSMSMRYADGATSPGLGIITGINNGSSSMFNWTLEAADNLPSGVFLYDTSTGYPVTLPTRYVVLGEAKTLAELNLMVLTYTGSSNYYSCTWTTTSSSISVDSSSGTVSALSCSDSYATVTGTTGHGKVQFKVYIRPVQNGTYFIRSRAYNSFVQVNDLDSENSYQTPGATIEHWRYDGGAHQKWVITLQKEGYYSIVSAKSGLALSVPSGQTETANATLVQESYNGYDRQKWAITLVEDGRYKIKAKSSENADYDLAMAVGYCDITVLEGTSIQQRVYSSDQEYRDEWLLCSFLDIGASTDNYSANEKRNRQSYAHVTAFYDELLAPWDSGYFTFTHCYNKDSMYTASKENFANNGAISNNIDFMIYIGHGHKAHNENGNHIQYSYSTEGIIDTDDVCVDATYTAAEIDSFCLFTSEVKFGSATSDLRWVWMYTCNFLNTNDYVSNNDLIAMMNGAHIVMGYATQSYLCNLNAELFAEYLRNGEPIITSFFDAGRNGEAYYANDNHQQKVLYIPQAEYETIYSPMIRYEYDASDVMIMTSYIKGDI